MLLTRGLIPCPDRVPETACHVKGRVVRTQGHGKVKVIVQGRGRLPAQVIVQRVHLIRHLTGCQGHRLQGREGHSLQGYGGHFRQGRRGHRLQGHGSEGYLEGHVIGNTTDGVGGARTTLIEGQGENEKTDRVAMFMEKSWNSLNFENFWKSHENFKTKIGEGHGKVMEFLNWSKKSWKNHGI